MAEIIPHPCMDFSTEETWEFPDGSSVTLKAGEGKHLTAALAVYLLEDVKFQIHLMLRAD